MKILIVCMGGVTTGLLAKQMQKYVEEQSLDDDIIAVGFNEWNTYVGQADMIFVAPQAAAYLEEIHKAADQETPVLLLGKGDIIQADLPGIFARIHLYRQTIERKDTEDGEQKRQKTTTKITWQVIKAGSRDCLRAVGLVLLCAGLLAICRKLLPIIALDWLYQAIVGLLGLYIIVCVGYTWGRALGHDPMTMTMVCLAACFMSFSYEREVTETVVMSIDADLGWLSTSWLGPATCPWLVLVSLSAVFLYASFSKRTRRNGALSYIKLPLRQVGPTTMTMLVFFGLRILVSLR